MRRTVCRGCESGDLRLLLDLGMMPLAGGFLRDAAEAASEERYPLPVHVCGTCGLVQILEVIDSGVLFKDYAFSSSTVGPLVSHFEDYAAWLVQSFRPATVVEFGCNDGVLLTPLGRQGVRAVGVDLSENITELARGKGLTVVTGAFDESLGERLAAELGPVDVVTGSNAFAHNDRPEHILGAAKKLLRPGGVLCLEVMYAGDLLEQMQWDTLYHEHLTFYSLGTLEVLLHRYGFRVLDATRLPMHGGSLRVVAGLDADAGERRAETAACQQVRAYERAIALSDPETWLDFGRRVGRKIRVTRETLEPLARHRRIWAYGAAGKATLWLNACDMTYLEAVVDASPLRAGRLMPGTHTPIVYPEALKQRPPDYVLVTAWNYADLIRSKEAWFNGIWCTPLPDLRFF